VKRGGDLRARPNVDEVIKLLVFMSEVGILGEAEEEVSPANQEELNLPMFCSTGEEMLKVSTRFVSCGSRDSVGRSPPAQRGGKDHSR